jgi:hypothetical protein
MLRKIKPIDPKEFADVEDINKLTIKGEMRKIYDEIHRKLTSGGFSAKDVVELLAKQGIQMSVELFRVYLRDLDIERGYKRSAKNLSSPQPRQTTATSVVNTENIKVFVPTPNSLAQIASSYSNNPTKEWQNTIVQELIRPEGITDVAWKDMKVIHLINKHRLKINEGN